jgi:hypothetical protein
VKSITIIRISTLWYDCYLMDTSLPIHDLYIRKLEVIEEKTGTRLPILRYDDHLLRRFAYAEMLYLQPVHPDSMRVRAIADEIWALINGKVRFAWHDLRSTSPTQNQKFQFICAEPTLVLVPFGVAFGVEVLDKPAILLRLASHMEGEHSDDRSISWEPEECP